MTERGLPLPVGVLRSVPFGHAPDGTPVTRFTLRAGAPATATDAAALELDVITYGAAIAACRHAGTDVVLGFDAMQTNDASGVVGYGDGKRNPFFGCTAGRVCNRIRGGKFTLPADCGAVDVTLLCNDGGGRHHLHGGPAGFDKAVWSPSLVVPAVDADASVSPLRDDSEAARAIDDDGDADGWRTVLALRLDSPHADGGYPGAVRAFTRFQVPAAALAVDRSDATAAASAGFRLVFEATLLPPTPTPTTAVAADAAGAASAAATAVSLTGHSYWNVAGHATGSEGLLRQTLHLPRSDRRTAHATAPVTSPNWLVPDTVVAVPAGDPYDFHSRPRRLGDALEALRVQDAAAWPRDAVASDAADAPPPPPVAAHGGGFDTNFVVNMADALPPPTRDAAAGSVVDWGGYDPAIEYGRDGADLRRRAAPLLAAGAAPVAVLHDPVSGRWLRLRSSAPGLQLYTGNWLDGAIGKQHAPYGRHAGLCLEPQGWPAAPNEAAFPPVWLRRGEAFRRVVQHDFGLGPP